MEQQSFFGFHAAIYTYDPAADIKFSTYVAKRIKWEICRYYERNGYTIRVPAFMKRRFRECLKKQQQLENTLSRKVSIEAALRELGLSDSIIAGTMAAFHRMKTTSIEAGIECSGEDSDASLLDFLSSDTDMENTVIPYYPSNIVQLERGCFSLYSHRKIRKGSCGVFFQREREKAGRFSYKTRPECLKTA